MSTPRAPGGIDSRGRAADRAVAGTAPAGHGAHSRGEQQPACHLHCERLEPRLPLAGDGIEPVISAPDPVAIGLERQPEQVTLAGDPAGAAASHRIRLAQGGFLDVSLAAVAGAIRGDRQLQLRDAAGTLVATSVESTAGVMLSHYLPAGDYDLSLAAPSGAVGTCTVVDTPAEPPGPLAIGGFTGEGRPADVTIAAVGRGGGGPIGVFVRDTDTNHPRVVVYIDLPDAEGRPSGRLQRAFEHRTDGGRGLEAAAIGDVDGDDVPDMVLAESDFITGTTTVMVLAGQGNGGFTPGQPLTVDGIAGQIRIADIDGDGRRDAVLSVTTADASSGSLVILWGTAAGLTASDALVTPGVGIPTAIVVGDFDGDGGSDLAAGFGEADGAAGRIDVWTGLDDRRDRDHGLAAPVSFALETLPQTLVAADLDGDGCDEIVVACQSIDPATGLAKGGSLTVLAGSTRGPRGPSALLELPATPRDVAVGDVDADGRPDVLVALDSSNVGMLQGDGRRGLAWAGEYAVGAGPYAVELADLDADGRPEIVTADYLSGTVTILGQRSDGSYPVRPSSSGGERVVLVDVNGDGRIDAVTRLPTQNAISVLLDRGDGTFVAGGRYAVGTGLDVSDMLIGITMADVNGDGRPDVVSANQESRSLTVLLGIGDGSFGRRMDLPLRDRPSAVVVEDVDGDGSSDIVVTTGVEAAGAVTVLYGTPGKLSFTSRVTCPVGFDPISVVVADVDGDGRRDLVVVNRHGSTEPRPGTLSVIRATHSRRFAAARNVGYDGRLADGGSPGGGGTPPAIFGVAADDFDANGRTDLALTMSRGDGNFLVMLDDFGPRGFAGRREIPLGSFPTAPVTGDVDGDGRPDVVVGLAPEVGVLGSIRVFRGGSPEAAPTTVTLPMPEAIAIADLDADGRGDVVAIDAGSRVVSFMSQPDGSLAEVGPGTFAHRRTNRVVPLAPSMGVPGGSVTLDRTGTILVRRDGGDGAVEAAGYTAFDVAAVRSAAGATSIAAIDDDRRGISLFALGADGSLGPRRGIVVPGDGGRAAILSRIRGADVDGDGNDDIVVSDPGTASIRVLLAGRGGDFSRSVWTAFGTAAGVSEFVLADVDGDRRPDLVAAGQVAGAVSVRHGLAVAGGGAGGPLFGPERRFLATARDAAFATDRYSGRGTPVSRAPINDVAVGDFDGDGRADIAVASAADRSLAILAGLPGGGFSAPAVHLPRAVAAPGPLLVTRAAEPWSLATGDFDQDGRADIAVLDRANEQVLVYLSGNGAAADPSGLPTATIPLVGNAVTSLLAVGREGPAGPDAVFDLVVGNDSGDVLVLRGQADAGGRGTGRFATGVRAEGGVALIATDIDGDGRTDFVYGSRSLDSVAVNTGADVEIFRADQRQGVIGPSAVTTVAERVAGADLKNLLVLNGAGNELLVFRRNPDFGAPFLAPQRFFVGSHPTALATADFNGDGIIDVAVANRGSGDLSILQGARGGDGRWTLEAGPRLLLGGSRPAALAVGDFVNAAGAAAADGIPDIAVTAAGRDAVTIVPGVGGGFFADNALRQLVLPEASNPAAVFAVPRGLGLASSLVVVNTGTSSISTFDAGRGFARADIPSGGLAPRSAAAYSQGGMTALAVANAGTGNVSVFLASPGSFLSAGSSAFAAVASSPNANASSLAFDSTGRLFGFAGGEAPPLALYSFSGSPLTATGSADSLRALISFLPSQLSGAGLVATLVTSAGISVAEDGARDDAMATRGTAARDREPQSLGGDGEPVEPAAEDAARDRNDVAEKELAPVLRFFLDLEAALEDTNARLLDTLLSRAADELEAARVARAFPPEPEAAESTPAAAGAVAPRQDAPDRTGRGDDAAVRGDRADRGPEARPTAHGLFAAFDPEARSARMISPAVPPGTFPGVTEAVWPTMTPQREDRDAPPRRSAIDRGGHDVGLIPRMSPGRPRPAAGRPAELVIPPTPAPPLDHPPAVVVSLLDSVFSNHRFRP